MGERITRYPGVYRTGRGRYRIKASRRTRGGRTVHRQRTLPDETTLKDAARARQDLDAGLSDELDGKPQEPIGEDPATTVADYAEHWLGTRISHFKPTTRNRYEYALTDWILPEVGHLRVDQLRPGGVRDWVSWAESQVAPNGEPYAKATLDGHWRIFLQLVRDATADHELPDPTRRVSGPTSRRKGVREEKVLDREQVEALVEAADGLPTDFRAEVVMLCRTGARRGEIHALRWADLDREGSVVTFAQAVSEGTISTTKTDSPRSVPVPPEVFEVIDEHERQMVRSQHPGAWGELVFPSRAGTPRTTSVLRDALRKAAELAGIDEPRVTPQVVRRSFNTLLLREGVSEVIVRSILGHTSQRMTALYAHVSDEAKKEALGLGPNRGKPKSGGRL